MRSSKQEELALPPLFTKYEALAIERSDKSPVVSSYCQMGTTNAGRRWLAKGALVEVAAPEDDVGLAGSYLRAIVLQRCERDGAVRTGRVEQHLVRQRREREKGSLLTVFSFAYIDVHL